MSQEMQMGEAGITVVVCSYNGAARLGKTLDCLLAQRLVSPVPVEILLVDNRSTDGTAQFVHDFFANHETPFKLRILKELKPGKAFAIETGYDAASHPILITCDDDNWLAPDYFDTALNLMQTLPDVGILGSRSQAVFESGEPHWFSKVAAANAVGGQAEKRGYLTQKAAMLWGAGMVLRKQVWKRLRACGFSFVTGRHVSKAVGEDSELSLAAAALGYKLFYAPELLLQHHMHSGRLTWQNMLRLSKGFGQTHAYLRYYTVAMEPDTDPAWLLPENYRKWMLRLKWRKVRDSIIKSRGAVLMNIRHDAGNMLKYGFVQQLACIAELRNQKRFNEGIAAIRKMLEAAKA
jgi:glycosyltransferase involved in cell wall biosynthesis